MKKIISVVFVALTIFFYQSQTVHAGQLPAKAVGQDFEPCPRPCCQLGDPINWENDLSRDLPTSELGAEIIASAEAYLGVPYVWGGATPSGFDCSGLVHQVYLENGLQIGRTTYAQELIGPHEAVEAARPGGLYFWEGAGGAYHVAIALGDGTYIHAPQPGQTVTYGHVDHFRPSFVINL